MENHKLHNSHASLLCRVTSVAQLRVTATIYAVLLLGLFVVQQAAVQRLVEPNGVVVGRDFLVFYTAGRMVNDGKGAQLYDPVAQKTIQDEILAPQRREGTSYYTNPASVAVAYAPISRLPYLPAFYLHTVLMAAILIAGVWVLCRRLPAIGRHVALVAILVLSWTPILNAVTGGQNSAITFTLLSVAYVSIIEQRRWIAGAALGLLFFKPQFALPLVGLLLLRREFIVCLAAGLGALCQYLIGAIFCGWDWPLRMLKGLRYFVAEERLANGANLISIREWVDYNVAMPLARLGEPGLVNAVAQVLSLAVVIALIGYLVWKWRNADPRQSDFGLYWALAVSATLLISPHTQHYDVAILALPVLLILDWKNQNRPPVGPAVRAALLVGFLAYPVFLLSPVLHVQILIIFPLAVFAWAVLVISRRQAEFADVNTIATHHRLTSTASASELASTSRDQTLEVRG